MSETIRKNKWSIDMCVGVARANKQFDEEGIPCTKTFYNMLWVGRIPLTPVGSRKGRSAAVFTAVEKVTHDYIATRISGRTYAGIEEAIAHLKLEYGEVRFSQVFKTITVDNGTEFETFTQLESLGTKVYFAPAYRYAERASQRHPPPIYPQRNGYRWIQ